MNTQGIILFNSSLVGTAQSIPMLWNPGGRTSLVINATAYGTLNLQIQGPSQAWINISSSLVSDQVFTFDAPAGNYRLNNTSSSVGVNAVLVSVPYK